MSSVNTYLNFERETEEAFNFYKSVFGGEFEGGIMRFRDIPEEARKGMPPLPEEDKDLVMHVSLKILGKHRIMGTDAPESMSFKLVKGNNVYITMEPDSKEEADRLFAALSEGGKVELPMQDMFWGDYYGSFTDKYGVGWMIDFPNKK